MEILYSKLGAAEFPCYELEKLAVQLHGVFGWEVAQVAITTAKGLLYKALLIFNKIVLETQLDQKLIGGLQ